MNTTPFVHTDPAVGPSGPANGKYHDWLPFVRRLRAASAFKVTAASFLRLPNFFTTVWPLGPTLLYIVLLIAGGWAALFLAFLTTKGGNPWMVAVPAVILIVEFFTIPIIKFPVFLGKSVASMRAYIASNRKTADSFQYKATAWRWQDWAAFVILLICLVLKLYILELYGTFQPAALLAANYIIAAADFAAHLGGVTSKVPYFALGRMVDAIHRRRRLGEAAAFAEAKGQNGLEPLPFRYFEVNADVEFMEDEVDGHELHNLGQGRFELRAPGTLDDSDRAGFLNRQGHYLAQAALARELAKVQLQLLDMPEMRRGRAIVPSQRREVSPTPHNPPSMATA